MPHRRGRPGGAAADRLASTDPAAAAMLRLSASFGPEPIPASFFTPAAELPAPLAAVAADPVRLHRSLGRISSYGLAHLDQGGMQVHRLVQAIVRDRLPAGQRRDDGDCVAALLVAAAPADTDNPAEWPAWAILLPHLLAANPAESDSADLRQLAARALLYLLRRGDSVTAETSARPSTGGGRSGSGQIMPIPLPQRPNWPTPTGTADT
jgi:hypothetical protein